MSTATMDKATSGAAMIHAKWEDWEGHYVDACFLPARWNGIKGVMKERGGRVFSVKEMSRKEYAAHVKAVMGG